MGIESPSQAVEAENRDWLMAPLKMAPVHIENRSPFEA